MSEQMLVCDALDERDFLRKKIVQAINTTRFVGAKRIKDTKVNAVDAEEFKKTAISEYQSLMDLIKRYEAIDIAITLANATTNITLRSGRTMTRAAGIALRKLMISNNNFNDRLLDRMVSQYDYAVDEIKRYNAKADNESETYKTNLAGGDKNKLSEENIHTIELLTKDMYGELVDPLDIKDKIDNLREEHNVLVKELDSAIKISNATTYIEI